MNRPYKQDQQLYNCVYWPSNYWPITCSWRGLLSNLLDHFKDKHLASVLHFNPSVMEYDSFLPREQNLITSAFNMVFLINTKVCHHTQHIYYCVRLLTDGNTQDYTYELHIDNRINDYIIQGAVVPPGCLAIDVSESIAVSFDCLLDQYGNKLSRNSFILTLKSSIVEPTNSHICEYQ